MTFAEAIKNMRKELKLSQEALAHELKVSFATINKWENSKTKPFRLTRDRILEFAKSKGVSGKIIEVLKSDF